MTNLLAYNYIDLGTDFTTSTMSIAGNLISDLSPYLMILLTVIVVVLIIKTIIH